MGPNAAFGRSPRVVLVLPDLVFSCEDGITSVFIRAPALPSVLLKAMTSTDGKAGARMIDGKSASRIDDGKGWTIVEFQLEAPFEPPGDQPQAIEALVDGLARRQASTRC